MPLLKFDLIKGRSLEQLRLLLDTTHETLVKSFGIPRSDRYQVVNEHEGAHVIAEDTGLGFPRTDKLVILQVISRPRSTAEKQDFYSRLSGALKSACGIEPSDLIISLIENSDADWSFGGGEAQFLTGQLPGLDEARLLDTD